MSITKMEHHCYMVSEEHIISLVSASGSLAPRGILSKFVKLCSCLGNCTALC